MCVRPSKMFPSFSPSLLIIFIFLTIIPPSFSAFQYPPNDKYRNCSTFFNCGNLQNISYPFWGNNRPQYCGIPGLELKCLKDQAEIQILSQSFRVLNIDSFNRKLRLSIKDDNCPTRFTNISLAPSSSFFAYSMISSAQRMTLFYSCPLIPLLRNNIFNCSGNGSNSNYYWIHSAEQNVLPDQALSRCNVSVIVPVLEDVNNSTVSTVEEVLRKGFDVEYRANFSTCYMCRMGGIGECGYGEALSSDGFMRPICYCSNGYGGSSCQPQQDPTIKADAKVWIVLLSVLVSLVLFVAIVTICCWRRRQTVVNYVLFWEKRRENQIMIENFLDKYGSLVPKRYSYSEIKKITSSFNDKIGEGGFGSVYKGKFNDGVVVAVKLLDKGKGNAEDFINEVVSISRTSHVNIVSILGFCFDGFHRALVYEFMPNGSMEKFIHEHVPLEEDHSQLDVQTLYQVVVGVARGLEYLHRGCNTRILHFDIKPHNILLDQDFTPKISDFGLAKVIPRKGSVVSMLGARGTIGYIAPEVFSRNFGGVSHKSDVYSYGMMVLEIVGRRKNFRMRAKNENTSEMYFPHWVHKRLELNEKIGLEGVTSKEKEETTKKMIVVALWCIQTNPMDRPEMSRVVDMLEGTHEQLTIPSQPYLNSPPRATYGFTDTGSVTQSEDDMSFL